MKVILVVFGEEALELSENLVGGIRSSISTNMLRTGWEKKNTAA